MTKPHGGFGSTRSKRLRHDSNGVHPVNSRSWLGAFHVYHDATQLIRPLPSSCITLLELNFQVHWMPQRFGFFFDVSCNMSTCRSIIGVSSTVAAPLKTCFFAFGTVLAKKSLLSSLNLNLCHHHDLVLIWFCLGCYFWNQVGIVCILFIYQLKWLLILGQHVFWMMSASQAALLAIEWTSNKPFSLFGKFLLAEKGHWTYSNYYYYVL